MVVVVAGIPLETTVCERQQYGIGLARYCQGCGNRNRFYQSGNKSVVFHDRFAPRYFFC
jgi:hypothetical protein